MAHPWSDLAAPFLLQTALWTIASVLAGVLLAIVSFLAIRRAGGYRLNSRHARAWRIATLLLMLLTLPTLVGGAGFLEGLHRGAASALHGQRMADEVYPWIGQLGADAIAGAYFSYRNGIRGTGELGADLEAFRANRRSIDTADVDTALRRLGPGAVDEATALVLHEAQERYPQLRRGFTGRLFRFALARVGDALHAWAAGRIRPLGVATPAAWLQDAVHAAASRGGDPSSLSHDELAAQLVDDAFVRPVLAVVRLYARAHQVLFVPWILLAIGGPLVLFWIARALVEP